MAKRAFLHLCFDWQTVICRRLVSRAKEVFLILISLALINLTVTNAIAQSTASYNLSISASTVQAGGSITVTWAAPSGSSGRDWVGLYKVGDPNRSFIVNKIAYTGGRTVGSFTTTTPTTPGTYEFRYLLDDGYTDVKRSSPIAVGTTSSQTPTGSSYNLSTSATSVQAGASVTVSWTAPSGSSAQDWVSLIKVGDTNQNFIANKWVYTGGKTSGSFTTTAPTTAGNYEFRYLINNGYTDVKRSSTIAVGTVSSPTPPPVGSYSLSPSASTVQAGASLTVSWTAPSGSSAQDWVSLIKVGDANQGYIPNKWAYTAGKTSGSFTTTAPTTAGNYEFRYLINNSYTDVKRSSAIGVSAVTTSTPPQTPPSNPVVPPTSCETGVSVAPCKPTNQRLLLVAQDGSGQFNNIQAAIDASLPGDTIQVKNGTYNTNLTIPANKSGTQSLPIALVNYPGHAPKVNGNLSIFAEWVLIEGFEITQSDYPITMYKAFDQYASIQKAGHITIRNNWIHDASFMGVFSASVSDLLFEGNTFERNGLGPQNCVGGDWGDHTALGFGYVHCHGIYLGSFTGDPPTDRVTVRRNKFISNTGSGLQNRQDSQASNNYLIENNLFINNERAMNLSDLNESTIRNNTIIVTDYPRPNSADKACWYMHNRSNVFANNACYISLDPKAENILAISNFEESRVALVSNGIFSHNAFFLRPGGSWIWGNVTQKDLLTTYKTIFNDPQGITGPVTSANGSEAGFLSINDSHLNPSSPLIGAGDSVYCAKVDFDGKARASDRCDIGAFGY